MATHENQPLLVTSRWATVGGLRYHYRVANASDGESIPLVLIHGLGVSSAYWSRILPLLAEHRPVYAVDLPGFGRTSHPRATLDIAGQAQALAHWLNALGLHRPHLIGHSAGGQVVAAFAATFAERVARLVLIAPTIGRDTPKLLAHLPGLLHDLIREGPSLLPVLIMDGLRAGPLHILRTDEAITKDNTLATVAKLATPMLVLRGTRDTIVSDTEIEQLLRAAPNSAFITIPGAPHVPQWSHPAAVAGMIEAFLSDPPPDSDGTTHLRDAGGAQLVPSHHA
jgi:pimeloyl-ACP methyl ester carboxylesterase